MVCADTKTAWNDNFKIKNDIQEKKSERVWNGFIWFRKGFSYTHLRMRSWTSVLHKRDGISWQVQLLLAVSGFSSMGSVVIITVNGFQKQGHSSGLLHSVSTYWLTILLTYFLTPWSRVLQKLTVSRLVKKFLAFYGTQRSITTLQNPTTSPYPEPDQFSPCPTTHFLKIHLNIILPPTPGSSKWSLSIRLPHQNPAYISPLPHICYMPRPSHYSRCHHPNNIWWGVQIIKLLIM